MELLLWRWSTAVQIASALMIAVFFTAFAASVRTSEVRWWMRAWLANLAALVVTLFFWYLRPEHFDVAIRSFYLGSKMLFAALMIEGAWAVNHPAPLLTNRQRTIALAVYTIAGGFVLNTIPLIGIGQHSLMAIIFFASGVELLRRQKAGSSWLAAGLIIRSLLAMIEAVAY